MPHGVLGVMPPKSNYDLINERTSPKALAFHRHCDANPPSSELDGGECLPLIRTEYVASNGDLRIGEKFFAIITVLFVIFLLGVTVVSFGILFSGGA